MDIQYPKPETQELLRQIWSVYSLIGRIPGTADHRLPIIRQIAESGDIAAISGLSELLLDESSEIADAASECVHRLLSETPVEILPSLEETVRGYGLAERSWRNLKPTQVSALRTSPAARTSILGVASFSPSGYVREAAVHELARIEDGSEIPFLLLRANDWVATVRGVANVALRSRFVASRFHDFARNAYLVLRLAECGREKHDDILEWFTGQLIGIEHEAEFLQIVRGPNRWLRRRCFRRAIEREGSHQNRLARIGLDASDVVLRFQSARQVRLSFPESELADALCKMEQDRFMPVRREALLARVEQQPDQAAEFLEKALLDRSASIRELARFYLGKIGRTDLAQVYRHMLPQNQEIGLMGLGETGDANDVPLAVPFLQHSKVAIRVAAVRLVANLGGENFIDDLLTALQDQSKKVALAAKTGLLSGSHVVSANRLWEIAENSPRQHVRLAATELLDGSGTWSSIPLLFRLSVHPDKQLASRATALIARRINQVFTSPSVEDRQRIQEAIDECRSRLPNRFISDFEKWLACR